MNSKMARFIWMAAVAGLCICAGNVGAAEKSVSYKLVKTVPIGGEGGWDYLAVDRFSGELYITHGTHVVIFDTKSNKVVGDINNTPGVHGVALAHPVNKGFISNGGDDTVTAFDLKTHNEVTRIKVGNRPDAIMFDHLTKRVFVFNARSKDCSVIDAAEDKVIATIPLAGKPEFAASDERGQVFVNIEDTSEIAVIDAKNMSLLKRWSIKPGEEPSGLAIDRKNKRLFSVCSNEKMIVTDSNSGKIVAEVPIGKGPDAAAFDDELQLAFSSNGGDGTLTVVKEESPDSFKVVENVKTAPLARTMALNPKTHNVYLVTAKAKPAQAGQRRREFEPGTFELLIVNQIHEILYRAK